MAELNLLVADPCCKRAQSGEEDWFAFGLSTDQMKGIVEGSGARDEKATRICQEVGDAALIRVQRFGEKPYRVELWKGITSSYEIFYTVPSDGDIVISDSFRNVLSRLPLAERHASHNAIVDHMLFRAVTGHETYCDGVCRLGHGEKATIGLDDRTRQTRLFDRVEDLSDGRSSEAYLEDVDQAIASVAGRIREEDSTVNLFSGGVDSVLLQYHLSARVPALTGLLERRAEAYESDYADSAAAVLGIVPMTFEVPENTYGDDLEQAISIMGLPPRQDQAVIYDRAFRHDFQRFICGEAADAVFGVGVRAAKFSSFFSSTAGVLALRLALQIAPASQKARLSAFLANTTKLRMQPLAPYGYAALTNAWSDLETLHLAFGKDVVEGRIVNRLDYVLGRADLAAPQGDRFLGHIEAAHWVNLLAQDGAMMHRQLGLGRGRTLLTPYLARPVLNACLSVPLARRYISGLEAKPILKNILRRHLPSYRAGAKKGASLSPVLSYFANGPLSDVWQRYAPPDCFDAKSRARFIGTPSDLTWNAAVYSIWRDRVLRNQQLAPCPNTRSHAWSL